jgi:hypothetical protein
MLNYRPISLLPTLSKIFEKVIYKWLLSHLNKYNILVKQQFGFRENFSTTLAIYNLLDNIYMALNNKCTVGGIFIFCNLKKAFNCASQRYIAVKIGVLWIYRNCTKT